MTLFASVIPPLSASMPRSGPSAKREEAAADQISIPAISLGALSFSVGVVVGLLGAGNFLFVPLLIYVLKIPTRITIGSSLAIHVLNGFAGFMGKLITGQVPFFMTLAIIIGASVGAVAGERSHSRVSPKALRYAYAGVIAVVALRIWVTLLRS